MSSPSDARLGILHPDVREYLGELGALEDPLVFQMEEYANERSFPLIGRDGGRWCELLSRAVQARRVFEFGSGWGYSAFFFARAVGAKGEVIGSEKDEWELDAHKKLFAGHPLEERICLIHGDAFEVFASTEDDFDVVFIDINKQDYLAALEVALPRVRLGGLILADNTLWGGKATHEPHPDDSATIGIRNYNRAVHAHPRLRSSILPVGDGLSVSLRIA
jgi:caffeoyl-CoA O-methyltransferase